MSKDKTSIHPLPRGIQRGVEAHLKRRPTIRSFAILQSLKESISMRNVKAVLAALRCSGKDHHTVCQNHLRLRGGAGTGGVCNYRARGKGGDCGGEQELSLLAS